MAKQTRDVILALLESDSAEDFKSWLTNLLRSEEVIIDFKKVDGSIRTMRCTLNEQIIPEKVSQTSNNLPLVETKIRKSSPDVRTVWDIDNRSWRSFRWNSLNSITWNDGVSE